MRYALGREYSHHLSPTHMTLFVQPQSGNRYLLATILDRGPDAYEWIKVQLPNGEEAFCYPDTDLTVDIKNLQPGHANCHINAAGLQQAWNHEGGLAMRYTLTCSLKM
jgi:hypothetical protein